MKLPSFKPFVFAPLLLPARVNQPFMVAFFISALIAIISIIGFLILQPEVPLWYSLPRLTQHLAPKVWLFLFPVISILLNVIHFSLMRFFQTYEAVLLSLFAWTTVVLQLLLGLALVRIVYITI